MDQLTAICYTGHRESEEFETKVLEHMVKTCGDRPIISVSQRPINVGENISIGETGCSADNSVRQFYIGVLAARTKYVCPVETDTIYPEEYYSFIPPTDDTFYLPEPTWILLANRRRCRYAIKRRGFEGALVASRDLVLRCINEYLGTPPEKRKGKAYIWYNKIQRFHTNIPVLSFKTSSNMNQLTRYDRETMTTSLEPFGEVYEFMKKFSLSRIR